MSFKLAGNDRLFELYISSILVLPCSTFNSLKLYYRMASYFSIVNRYTVSKNQCMSKGVSFIDTEDVFILNYIHCFGHQCSIPLPITQALQKQMQLFS